jgi:metal-responsive CopG/Arc/MetJ family transcriptional regulator
MRRMKVICFRIPETLLKSINELAEKLGYAIRALLREKARELVEQIMLEGSKRKSVTVVGVDKIE